MDTSANKKRDLIILYQSHWWSKYRKSKNSPKQSNMHWFVQLLTNLQLGVGFNFSFFLKRQYFITSIVWSVWCMLLFTWCLKHVSCICSLCLNREVSWHELTEYYLLTGNRSTGWHAYCWSYNIVRLPSDIYPSCSSRSTWLCGPNTGNLLALSSMP